MLIYKTVNLDVQTIRGQDTLGAGNVIPNKIYGTIPNPAPAVHGGGIFTPANYGLPNANAGTPLQVVLEGQIYTVVATRMFQMYHIFDGINYDNEIPADAEIVAETASHLEDIRGKARKLFDVYGKSTGIESIVTDIRGIKKTLENKLV